MADDLTLELAEALRLQIRSTAFAELKRTDAVEMVVAHGHLMEKFACSAARAALARFDAREGVAFVAPEPVERDRPTEKEIREVREWLERERVAFSRASFYHALRGVWLDEAVELLRIVDRDHLETLPDSVGQRLNALLARIDQTEEDDG